MLETMLHTASSLVHRGRWKPAKLLMPLLLAISFFATMPEASAKLTARMIIYVPSGSNKVYFSDSSTGGRPAYWRWTFGDGTTGTGKYVTHTYSSVGTYHVCLTVKDSMGIDSSTVCDSVVISTSCAANFNYSLSGNKLTLTDNSSGSPSSYYWDFGDGDTSYVKNPTHTYSSPGYYYVCLTAKNASTNCQSTFCAYIHIASTSCLASYTASVSGKTATFTNTSKSVYNQWDFGDGSYSLSRSPSHTYASPGTYKVCLTVKDSAKTCMDQHCDSVVITGSSTCDATFGYTGSGKTFNFSNTTGSYVHYMWSFGDGTVSYAKAPSHTYSTSGKFTVCLVVSDSIGTCSDTSCLTLDLSCGLKASFTSLITGNKATFSNHSTGSIVKYKWNFGDGSISTSSSPSHTYSSGGMYNVCLTVSDSSGGCRDTYCDTVTIRTCVIQAGFTVSGTGRYKSFTNTSTGYITSYTWSFGDGTSSHSSSPNHTYSSNGTYYVCLTAYDSTINCSSTHCDTLTIFPCRVSFNVSVSGKDVTLTAIDSAGKYRTFLWWYGDGDSTYASDTSGLHTTHKYSGYGTYQVCLHAWDTTGCDATYCANINLTGYSISGLVKTKSGVRDMAHVYLIQYDATDTSLTAIDTTWTYSDSLGHTYYKFTNLDPGTYYTKAALDTMDSLYSKYVPTYYMSSKKWKNADAIVISTSSVYNADIDMKKGSNTGGAGFIGGKVSQGANKKEGDPIANVQVMVVDVNDDPVAYTYSDIDGNFAIPNLAFGTYRVYAEVLGLEPVEAELTLTSANPRVDNVDIKVNTKSVVTAIWQPFDKRNAQPVTIYPNPSNGRINLSFSSEKTANATLYIYNYTGQLVEQKPLNLVHGQQNIGLDVNTLPGGLYLIRLDAGQSTAAWEGRFIKN